MLPRPRARKADKRPPPRTAHHQQRGTHARFVPGPVRDSAETAELSASASIRLNVVAFFDPNCALGLHSTMSPIDGIDAPIRGAAGKKMDVIENERRENYKVGDGDEVRLGRGSERRSDTDMRVVLICAANVYAARGRGPKSMECRRAYGPRRVSSIFGNIFAICRRLALRVRCSELMSATSFLWRACNLTSVHFPLPKRLPVLLDAIPLSPAHRTAPGPRTKETRAGERSERESGGQ